MSSVQSSKRQVRILKYTHERRLHHRALSLQKILVTTPEASRPAQDIREEAGERIRGPTPGRAASPQTGGARRSLAPAKYCSADFLKPAYWRLRDALDVPKDRFASFPHMSRDRDPTLLVGWAGWDTLELCQTVELCQAVAACYTRSHRTGRLEHHPSAPLLAVLQENLPWLKQWHNEVDPEYDQRLGDFFETFLHSQLSNLGLTEADLRAWAPPGIVCRGKTKRETGNADRSAIPDSPLPSVG